MSMSSKKRFAIEGTNIKCSSKSEVIVGQKLFYSGYRFIYDKKYPYDDIETNLRFDFMILNSSDTEENIKTKHHLFIEVKDDDKDYLESLQAKRDLVNNHDDVLIVLTDKEMDYQIQRVKEGYDMMKIKADYKRLQFENRELKAKLAKYEK